jgi:signal transduction histidine kinase/DNA-binding response OmpR family regulator/streptogramin lyase
MWNPSLKNGFILLLLLLLIGSGFAQISFDNPQIINKKSGLPTDNIEGILKDDLGFMWFATNRGLYRWDGISVKVFTHDPADSSSIPGNFIPENAFVFDTVSKQILLATENGLSFFDPHQLTFKNFRSSNKSTGFPSKINAIFIDRQNMIWLGTASGIVRFVRDGNTYKTQTFSAKSQHERTRDKEKINQIFDIKQDVKNDDVLWLASLEGLLKFNKNSGEFTLFLFKNTAFRDELNLFIEITAHQNQKLYIGTWNADMLVFNTVTEQFEFSFGPYSSEQRYFLSSPLVPCLEKSENELWVTSREGPGIFNTLSNTLKIIKTFKNTEGNKYAPVIAFQDKKAIWLSSEYGAIRVPVSNQYFENYFIPPLDEKHWFLTQSFFEDTTYNRLYIGYARGRGLHYFDLKNNTFDFVPFPKRIVKENNIKCLLPLNQTQLLVLSIDEVYQYSLKTQKVHPLHIQYSSIPKFTGIAIDDNKRIWICGANSGLGQLDIKSGKIRNIHKIDKFYKEKEVLPKLKGIAIDKQNRIWFSDEESYGFYNPDTDSLHYFDGAKAQNISAFLQDESDTIWVGVERNGIGFINPKQAEKGVQIIEPAIHKSVRSLLRDNQGNFFLLTASGIEKLKPGQKQTVVFNENEGLVKFDIWSNRDPTQPGKIFKLSDGRFVIGYRRGLGFFYPDSLHKTESTCLPYISSLNIFGKEIPIQDSAASATVPEFSHNQNSMTFEYSALALNNGKDILFAHRLSNIDQDWVVSLHRNVNYSNLLPGKYRFTVRAWRENSPDLSQETSFGFIIRTPWWTSWWAIALYVLAFAGIIYSIYYYQLSRILARKETTRLRELDRLKSHLYANITHEFRTPLTVIKGVADDMLEKMKPDEQKRFNDKLEMIERNSNKLLHLVQQMLDMSKIEEGKMKLRLIRDNIVSYLQYVMESFQSMADAKNIKLVFYHETGSIIMDFDQDKIFVIASNLLSNAIKFTPSGGKVIFHVKKERKNEQDHLVIKVQDSGIGIKEEHLGHIFNRFYQVDNSETRKNEGTGIGLALTKELTELMNGEISVKSTAGKRTEFCVSIPISTNAPLQKARAVVVRPEQKELTTIEVVGEARNENLPLALVVEDNPDVAKYIISCLAGKYRVKWSPDGEQGISTAIEVIPDIIISDVMMPGKDGFEVCKILKNDEHTSHIPLILLTAKATEADRIEGLSHGADAYLTKPFNKKELFVRLEQLIKIRQALREKYSKVEISISQKARPTGEERFLKKAVAFIEQNLDSPELNTSLMAEGLNMSESQLYRKLKALSGKSTAIFIRGIRLSAAKNLLETSEFNISEIAYQCGFSEPAWFSRSFKEEFGVSPSAFRK